MREGESKTKAATAPLIRAVHAASAPVYRRTGEAGRFAATHSTPAVPAMTAMVSPFTWLTSVTSERSCSMMRMEARLAV
jgi:hypothetical protein